MTGGYIEKRIKRANSKLIIFGIIGLIIVLVAMLSSINYYIQFFSGPYLLTSDDLNQFMASNDINKRYVTVIIDQLFDSGMYTSSTEDDGTATIEERRYIVTVDDLQFVYSSDSYNGEKTLTGQLYWLASGYDEQFARIARNSALNSGSHTFLPFVLVDENFTYRGVVGLVIAGLVLLLAILLLVKGIQGVLHPESNHGLRALQKLGPIDFTISRINSEMEFPHQSLGKTHFLTTWLVMDTSSGFTAVRYEDIVWVYKQSVANKNFGIKFANVEALIINDRFERSIYLPWKTGQLDAAMSMLLPHIPYSYKGFSDELANVWRQNPQTLIRSVEERGYTGGTPASPPENPPTENTSAPIEGEG